MTTDGLRDDLARAICAGDDHIHGVTVPCWGSYRDADRVLPVVEAAVTTATETLRDGMDVLRESINEGADALADARDERDAARGEVAAARTEGFNTALDAVLAVYSVLDDGTRAEFGVAIDRLRESRVAASVMTGSQS
jgi:hypothetical protein